MFPLEGRATPPEQDTSTEKPGRMGGVGTQREENVQKGYWKTADKTLAVLIFGVTEESQRVVEVCVIPLCQPG